MFCRFMYKLDNSLHSFASLLYSKSLIEKDCLHCFSQAEKRPDCKGVSRQTIFTISFDVHHDEFSYNPQ